MGLFDKIFGRHPVIGQQMGAYKTLTAYQPTFYPWDGNMYSSELIRSAIDAKARNISKLQVTFNGAAKPWIKTALRAGPNEWQTWSQFLYRLDTILEAKGTAFIVPVLDSSDDIIGYSSIMPSRWELVENDGEPWIRFHFQTGSTSAIELARVGIMVSHQYEDDMFGTSNDALKDTLQLLDIQRQGIAEGVKNSATFRFMARVGNFTKPEDLAKERRRFDR